MLGHQYIASDDKPVFPPHCLKLKLEDSVRFAIAQQRLPSMATEGEKVEDSAFLVTDKALRHGRPILLPKMAAPRSVATHPSAMRLRKDGAPDPLWPVRSEPLAPAKVVGHPPFARKKAKDGAPSILGRSGRG